MKMNFTVGYRDKKGKEISLLEWADLFEDMQYRLIATEMVGNTQVSTIWLGLLDLWGNYFETCIFDENRNVLDLIRYASLEEAKLGQEAEVFRIKNELDKR